MDVSTDNCHEIRLLLEFLFSKQNSEWNTEEWRVAKHDIILISLSPLPGLLHSIFSKSYAVVKAVTKDR